jgi:3-oxoacyl-[acyl-carrier-protein] synthase II
MKAFINGIGWVTPAGYGQGRQCKHQPLQSGVLEIPTRKQVFVKIDRRFGRLDDFSRIGLAALTFCLRDGNAEEWQEKRPLGIVATSRYGCLQTDLAYLETMLPHQGKLASPNLFAYTLPNCFLGEAALRFGLTGNSMIINRHDPGRLESLRVGLTEMAWSDQSGVLAGVADLAPPSELAVKDDLPGSLFMLLEKEQKLDSNSYGEIEMKEGRLSFNGEVVDNLLELVAACLKDQYAD